MCTICGLKTRCQLPMNYSEEILKQVEELSGVFLTPEEISMLASIDYSEFSRQIRLKKGDLYIAYFRGKTIAKKEIHQNIVRLAKQGSPLAEDLAHKMMINQEIAENGKR